MSLTARKKIQLKLDYCLVHCSGTALKPRQAALSQRRRFSQNFLYPRSASLIIRLGGFTFNETHNLSFGLDCL